VELKSYVSIFISNAWNQLCSFLHYISEIWRCATDKGCSCNKWHACCRLFTTTIERRMIRWWINWWFERLGKSAITSSILCRICVDCLRKTTKNISQDDESSGRRLNPGPPNTEATVPSLTATFGAALCTKWMADRFLRITFRVVRGKTWALADSVGVTEAGAPPPRVVPFIVL
jgi:hypothetical protein